MIKNSKGKIYYGMHMYPGVARYDQENITIFLNENTIRKMDETFAGRPVFVRHVDGVEDSLDVLKNEADGWVVKSFFNESDGKHWCQFIVCSEKGEEAIQRGFRLSNCYVPKQFGNSGIWNGVNYDKEVTGGEYEHLALVPDPRYDESVVLTPEEFKAYNEKQQNELSKIANAKGENKMVLNLFKRTKVENALDIENTMVELPKSKKEMSIAQVINAMDEHYKKENEPKMAEGEHHLEIEGKKMTVNEFLSKHKELQDAYNSLHEEHEKLKDEMGKGEYGSNMHPTEEEHKPAGEHLEDSADDEEALKKAKELEAHEKAEIEAGKKKNEAERAYNAAKKKADALRNAKKRTIANSTETAEFLSGVERGKASYGM